MNTHTLARGQRKKHNVLTLRGADVQTCPTDSHSVRRRRRATFRAHEKHRSLSAPLLVWLLVCLCAGRASSALSEKPHTLPHVDVRVRETRCGVRLSTTVTYVAVAVVGVVLCGVRQLKRARSQLSNVKWLARRYRPPFSTSSERARAVCVSVGLCMLVMGFRMRALPML